MCQLSVSVAVPPLIPCVLSAAGFIYRISPPFFNLYIAAFTLILQLMLQCVIVFVCHSLPSYNLSQLQSTITEYIFFYPYFTVIILILQLRSQCVSVCASHCLLSDNVCTVKSSCIIFTDESLQLPRHYQPQTDKGVSLQWWKMT